MAYDCQLFSKIGGGLLQLHHSTTYFLQHKIKTYERNLIHVGREIRNYSESTPLGYKMQITIYKRIITFSVYVVYSLKSNVTQKLFNLVRFMTKPHKSNRDVWNIEAFVASDQKVWLCKAHDLRQSATLLFQYEEEVRVKIFIEKKPTRLPLFWTAGQARMLIGFSLENLLKAILLKNPDHLQKVFSKEGKLSWGNDGHNLVKLSSEAGISWSDTQHRYLELWQMCSTWAGRYPIPTNENQLPRQRKEMPSRDAFKKRSIKRLKKAIDNNDPFKGAELWDQLHTGIGDEEFNAFVEMYDSCISVLESE